MCQSGLNSPAVTQMCQPGRVTPLVTQMCQSGSASASLVTQTCQSRSVTPLVTQMCQTGSANLWTTSTGQPGSGNVFEASMPSLVEANDTTQVGVCDPNGRVNQGGQQLNVCETNNNEPTTPRSIVGSVVNFDPQSMPTGDEFMFEAHTSINEYLEKHMRCTLNKENRTLMHKEHPVPKTPAMRPPQVDKFIKDHLGARFPAREDGEFAKVQSALLKTCGPIACLWSELIKNGLLED